MPVRRNSRRAQSCRSESRKWTCSDRASLGKARRTKVKFAKSMYAPQVGWIALPRRGGRHGRVVLAYHVTRFRPRLRGRGARRRLGGGPAALERELRSEARSDVVPLQVEEVFVLMARVRAQVPRAALNEIPPPAASHKVVRLFVVDGASVGSLIAGQVYVVVLAAGVEPCLLAGLRRAYPHRVERLGRVLASAPCPYTGASTGRGGRRLSSPARRG